MGLGELQGFFFPFYLHYTTVAGHGDKVNKLSVSQYKLKWFIFIQQSLSYARKLHNCMILRMMFWRLWYTSSFWKSSFIECAMSLTLTQNEDDWSAGSEAQRLYRATKEPDNRCRRFGRVQKIWGDSSWRCLEELGSSSSGEGKTLKDNV